MDLSAHREKLLLYLENEYESLNDKNEQLTNRASVTAALLTGFAFLVLSDENIKNAVFCITCINVTIKICILLKFLFCISMISLICILMFRKNFEKWDFYELYYDLFVNYGDELPQNDRDLAYFTEQLIFMCDDNRRALNIKAIMYNVSMIMLLAIVLLFLYYH